MAYAYPQGWTNSQPTWNYQLQQPQNQPQFQSQTNGRIIWVQGEAGAKSYFVAPGEAVVLFDSEKPVFYVKSTDPSGMPQPLKVYDFSEHKFVENQQITQPDLSQYVKKDELEKYLNELLGGSTKGAGTK